MFFIKKDFPTKQDILHAYLACRKRKRKTINALAFEIDLEKNLSSLYEDLVRGRYQIGRSICFVVLHPKPREIFAGDFRDRVVHHLLCERIAPYFERRFVYDSSASQVGKGVLFASQRLRSHIRKSTHNGKKNAWYLQMDIKNFFGSLSKDVLKDCVLPPIPKGFWRDLTEKIIDHDPTRDYVFKGDPLGHLHIPDHKTLFSSPDDRGLPIGNLTSQFFANVYLNRLDQYVKRTLGCRYYQRYVDDFVLVSEDRSQLLQWRDQIKNFVKKELHIEIHPQKIIQQSVYQGINYIGFVHKPHRRYVRKKIRGDFENRLCFLVRAKKYSGYKLAENDISMINSYLGFLGYQTSEISPQRILEYFLSEYDNFTLQKTKKGWKMREGIV